MRINEILKAANALSDEEIEKWKPEADVPQGAVVVHTFSLLNDRTVRALIALQNRTVSEAREKFGAEVDLNTVSSKEFGELTILQSTLQTFGRLIDHEQGIIARSDGTLPEELHRRADLEMFYGEDWSVVLVDPNVMMASFTLHATGARPATST